MSARNTAKHPQRVRKESAKLDSARAAYDQAYRLDGPTPTPREHVAGAYVEELEAELERLRDLVDDLTLQATGAALDGVEEFDSMALNAYAEGLRDMAARGKVRIIREVGRRVIAVPVKEDDR
jgi:hypothetical protein